MDYYFHDYFLHVKELDREEGKALLSTDMELIYSEKKPPHEGTDITT